MGVEKKAGGKESWRKRKERKNADFHRGEKKRVLRRLWPGDFDRRLSDANCIWLISGEKQRSRGLGRQEKPRRRKESSRSLPLARAAVENHPEIGATFRGPCAPRAGFLSPATVCDRRL